MNKQIIRVKSLNEFHRLRGLPKPEHPLISLINYADIKQSAEITTLAWIFDFYSIALKRNAGAKFRYGQQDYDFDEGTMFFIAPGQVFRIEVYPDDEIKKSGFILLIHPDFLWEMPLGKTIKSYEYFGYTTHEALFLSAKEESIITGILKNIQQEYHANIDKFSQQIIISQIEVLLNYGERFYNRQFITRRISNRKVLEKLETLLNDHFDGKDAANGLPTVNSLAEHLSISPDYLSTLLKVTTGQNTQQHIHEKLISKAKERLLGTMLSVSEIAFELGFEHPQSFSKLFKNKTNMSPLKFRRSLN